MLNKDTNINDLFRNALADAEVPPPGQIWNNLEASLEKGGVEGIYKRAFTDSAITPAKNMWNKIAVALFFRQFVSFNPTKFNVYYTALVSIVGVVCYNVFFDKQPSQDMVPEQVVETSLPAVTTNKQKESATVMQNKHIQDVAVENKNNSTSPSKTELVEKNKGNKSTLEKQMQPANVDAVDFSNIRIVGKTKLCAFFDSEYSLEGLPMHAEVEWNLSQRNAVLKFISTRKIIATWNKDGAYTISALVTIANTKKKIELPVIVEASVVPIIKGRDKVCEGQEKIRYTVEEPVDRNITYLWNTRYNTIDFIGNKYINIDWHKSGRDTLTVTRIDNESGCKSQSSMIVQVSAKPSANFEMTPLGNSEFEFKYLGNAKRVSSITWNIEGVEYSQDVVVHQNTGVGNSIVILQVKDRNNCINTSQKEISFNRHVLFVPSKVLITDESGFIPQTNHNLRSYKLEIYNARNEKIWESSELVNGKPAKSWDGTSKGLRVSRGKYYWKISAVFDDGTQWKGVMQPNGELKPNGIFILEN